MTEIRQVYLRGVRRLVLRRGRVIRTLEPRIPTADGVLYTGVTVNAGPYIEADILGLGNTQNGTSAGINISLAPINQYVVHAWPASFGSLTSDDFTLGTLGFPGDMLQVQSGLSVNGVPYNIGRSDFLLDATTPGAGGTLPLVVMAA